MHLIHKPGPVASAGLFLPEKLPALPEETLNRFPSLADWQRRVDQWWFDTRTALMRERDAGRQPVAGAQPERDMVAEIEAKLASFQTELAKLSSGLAALAENVASLAVHPSHGGSCLPKAGQSGLLLHSAVLTPGGASWAPVDLSSGVEVVGVLGIGNGGTGQTTKPLAFDALAPTTTKGDLIVQGTSGNQALPVGEKGAYLRSDGEMPYWEVENGTGSPEKVFLHVELSEDTELPSGTSILPLDNPTLDNKGGWSATNYKYTVPQTGLYRCCLTVAISVINVACGVFATTPSDETRCLAYGGVAYEECHPFYRGVISFLAELSVEETIYAQVSLVGDAGTVYAGYPPTYSGPATWLELEYVGGT